MEQFPRLDMGFALQQIQELFGRVMAMGANDSEHALFRRIKQQVEAGEITPQAGVMQAQAVLDGKQDYH